MITVFKAGSTVRVVNEAGTLDEPYVFKKAIDALDFYEKVKGCARSIDVCEEYFKAIGMY